MASRKDDKLLAELWFDEPHRLASLLRTTADWLTSVATQVPAAGTRAAQDVLIVPASIADELEERVAETLPAFREYRRLIPKAQRELYLLDDLQSALADFHQARSADPDCREIRVPGFTTLMQQLEELEVRAGRQQKLKQRQIGDRSDVLGTTIEDTGEEILVRTDKNGSLKLRGSAGLPLFRALWNAPGHSLSHESFCDVDRGSSETSLERHRARLCSKLQEVLLEVVREQGGVRLRKAP